MSFIESTLKKREDLRRFILGCFKPEVLAAESARKELNASLQSHWPEHPIEVYELIHEKYDASPQNAATGAPSPSENFIVFIDSELDIDWIADKTISEESAELISLAESVGARRCHHLPREQVLEFKRIIGQAIVSALQGSKKQPQKLANEAAVFLKNRTVERSRVWTLCSSHLLILSFLIFAWLVSNSALFQVWNAKIPVEFWLATAGGLVGAYLSVIQKTGSGDMDAASGKKIHAIEVLTKLVAGFLLGGIAFALSQSVHAPPSLKAITADSPSMFLFSFAAGFIERLIPRMVSRYSESIQK